MYLELLSALLPEGILENFVIRNVQKGTHHIEIYLEENFDTSWVPDGIKVHSKGFHKSVVIKDFPIRDKMVLLNVRRRRWENTSTNEEIRRDFSLIADGTRMTSEFASFLKGIS
jgi:hypothetical protein